MHGKGVYTFVDQKKYDGFFKNNKQDGIGTLKDKNGNILYEGEWKMGQIVKENDESLSKDNDD